jgi:hypothetical protein
LLITIAVLAGNILARTLSNIGAAPK